MSDRQQTNINDYLISQRDMTDEKVNSGRSFPLAKRVVCRDGFSLSVQATHGAYCSPRTNRGPWDQVEVGYPSAMPELIMDYAEDPDRPTDTVYGYVPVALINQLIDLHGGMAAQGEQT